MYFVRSGVTRASIGSPQPSQTPFIMSYNGKIQTANHATKPLGILPRFHHVAFSDPPEQQCYLTTINTMPPGWCIPVFPFRSGANERIMEIGNEITFAEAAAAIMAHHARLYNLLLAALPAYSGGKTPPQKIVLHPLHN